MNRREFMRQAASALLSATGIAAADAELEGYGGPAERVAGQAKSTPGGKTQMDRRGLHVMAASSSAMGATLGSKAALPALERLIAEVAPGLGFNWMVLCVAGHFAYRTHPEAAEPDSMDADDARRLAELARDHGIRLVPEYNCLGHQSFQEKPHALLRSHPEFNEAPDMDMRAFAFHNFYSWCPNRPGIYAIVFDLLDELAEAFQTDSLHVGMDEVFVLGECLKCKGTRNAELFAQAVNDIHDHVVGKRDLEMLMWGDRLLSPSTGYNMWERSNNDTEDAIDLIPRDIVVCDWHYEVMEQDDYPSVRYLQEKGFRVWPAGWNETGAVRRLIEVARRDETERMLGYLATTWGRPDELAASLSGEPVGSDDKELPRVVSCVRLAAELLSG